TALRMIASIMTPTAGTASVCGFDTQKHPIEVKRNLGFLSGDTALYKRLSSRELMAYFGGLHEIPKEEIKERSDLLIEQLDMKDFADRVCGTLSAGQQQRANIARTLIHDPQVLILDEPTNALDIISGKFILEFIQDSREKKKTILFSTHTMAEAEYLCDYLILLHEGIVRAEGSLSDLKERYGKETLTEIFLGIIEEAPCAGK
ncbi:MAG: ATP-binding cassette domain-containing protein, partial [Lentisphaeria bacterium]|nr:ATP-binding cassette domain-containing protein [Lentisphaeria bacterium]